MSDSGSAAVGDGRILVVEDEREIAALVAYQLTRAGYSVATARDGAEALAAIERERPDLVVLDVMLPGLSGLDVLKALRGRPGTADVPVLLLTARREVEDRIRGFEHGADDYLSKPFSPRELVLRVGAILRRSEVAAERARDAPVSSGALTLDPSSARALLGEEELALTPTEFRLLHAFLSRPGKILARRELLELAWELDSQVAGRLQTRTVDMHVRRLREKLGAMGRAIETVRGFGYRFEPASGE